jgi:hypothetical protein
VAAREDLALQLGITRGAIALRQLIDLGREGLRIALGDSGR